MPAAVCVCVCMCVFDGMCAVCQFDFFSDIKSDSFN